MTTRDRTYVTAPSHEQLEAAWWELMQGELGLDHDRHTADFMQAMYDHVRRMAEAGCPILEADGEPLSAVSGDEMAKRMVSAYASLFYGP